MCDALAVAPIGLDQVAHGVVLRLASEGPIASHSPRAVSDYARLESWVTDIHTCYCTVSKCREYYSPEQRERLEVDEHLICPLLLARRRCADRRSRREERRKGSRLRWEALPGARTNAWPPSWAPEALLRQLHTVARIHMLSALDHPRCDRKGWARGAAEGGRTYREGLFSLGCASVRALLSLLSGPTG